MLTMIAVYGNVETMAPVNLLWGTAFLLLFPNFTSEFVDSEQAEYKIRQLQRGVHQDKIVLDSRSPHRKNEKETENVVEPPLLVGSFNIQTLAKRKFSNLRVMNTVKKVILRYDVILIMEIMVKDKSYLQKLLMDVNNLISDGEAAYNMTVGESHPDTLEQCAYFWRTDKLILMQSESFENQDNEFYRKPLVAVFHTPTLKDMVQFILIGLHVKPDRAVQELDSLADLYDFVHEKYDIEDVLLLGDFNADCDYVKETNWERISLWTRHEFTWAIRDHVDTTTNYRSCALDRFVYAGENMNDGVIPESAQIFNFQEELDLTTNETRAVSDHWPIELKIRGKLSAVAQKNIISDICFKIKDLRSPTASKEDVYEATEFVFFTVTVIQDGFLLRNETDSIDSLKSALADLRGALPGAVTSEQYQSTLYKLDHGALNDDSSYSDIEDSVYEIDVVLQSDSSTVMVCRRSSVN